METVNTGREWCGQRVYCGLQKQGIPRRRKTEEWVTPAMVYEKVSEEPS